MKKFLSLVLALIMTMSLVTIGAGATEYRDLTDKDEIQYEEAVAVLNRIGVITGYEDGSFRPEGELTRGAAAKIIVSLLIGPEAASNLPNNSAPYPDVPASHTFAGVISYCKTAGIISGYGDGTFKPGNSLTGFAFAKMLLGALGYKSEIEGFVDTGWTMNVARVGNVTGLFDRLDFDGAASVNREQACQLALNTLKATMVTYGGTTLVTGAQTLAVQGTQAMYVTSNNREINANINRRVISATNNEMTLEFGEEHFKDLRLEHDKFDPAYDVYGHPSNEWSWKKVTIGTFKLPADFTFTKQMAHLEDTQATKEKALGLRGYDTYSTDHSSNYSNWSSPASNNNFGYFTMKSPFANATQIHINGWKARVQNEAYKQTNVPANEAALDGEGRWYSYDAHSIGDSNKELAPSLSELCDLTDNGVTVEVYVCPVDADFITDVVVTRTQLMEVDRIASDYVELDVIDSDSNDPYKAPSLADIAGYNDYSLRDGVISVKDNNYDAYNVLKDLKSGDYVAVIPYTTDNGKTWEVGEAYVPETVSGALTNVDIYNTRSKADGNAIAITVGGTTYPIAQWNKDMREISGVKIRATKKDVTLYLDKLGNALLAKDVGNANAWIIVGDYYQATLSSGRVGWFVHGWTIKGDEVDLELGSIRGAAEKYAPGELVKYDVSSGGDGEYELTKPMYNNDSYTGGKRVLKSGFLSDWTEPNGSLIKGSTTQHTGEGIYNVSQFVDRTETDKRFNIKSNNVLLPLEFYDTDDPAKASIASTVTGIHFDYANATANPNQPVGTDAETAASAVAGTNITYCGEMDGTSTPAGQFYDGVATRTTWTYRTAPYDGVKFIFVGFDAANGNVEVVNVLDGVQNVDYDDLKQINRWWRNVGTNVDSFVASPAEAYVDKDGKVKAVVIKSDSVEANLKDLMVITNNRGTNTSIKKVGADEAPTSGTYYTRQYVSGADGFKEEKTGYFDKALDVGTVIIGSLQSTGVIRSKVFHSNTYGNRNPDGLYVKGITPLKTQEGSKLKTAFYATTACYLGAGVKGGKELTKSVADILDGFSIMDIDKMNNARLITVDSSTQFIDLRDGRPGDINELSDLFNTDKCDPTTVELKVLVNGNKSSDGFRHAYAIMILTAQPAKSTSSGTVSVTAKDSLGKPVTNRTGSGTKADPWVYTIEPSASIELTATVNSSAVEENAKWTVSGTTTNGKVLTAFAPDTDTDATTGKPVTEAVFSVTLYDKDKDITRVPAEAYVKVQAGTPKSDTVNLTMRGALAGSGKVLVQQTTKDAGGKDVNAYIDPNAGTDIYPVKSGAKITVFVKDPTLITAANAKTFEINGVVVKANQVGDTPTTDDWKDTLVIDKLEKDLDLVFLGAAVPPTGGEEVVTITLKGGVTASYKAPTASAFTTVTSGAPVPAGGSLRIDTLGTGKGVIGALDQAANSTGAAKVTDLATKALETANTTLTGAVTSSLTLYSVNKVYSKTSGVKVNGSGDYTAVEVEQSDSVGKWVPVGTELTISQTNTSFDAFIKSDSASTETGPDAGATFTMNDNKPVYVYGAVLVRKDADVTATVPGGALDASGLVVSGTTLTLASSDANKVVVKETVGSLSGYGAATLSDAAPAKTTIYKAYLKVVLSIADTAKIDAAVPGAPSREMQLGVQSGSTEVAGAFGIDTSVFPTIIVTGRFRTGEDDTNVRLKLSDGTDAAFVSTPTNAYTTSAGGEATGVVRLGTKTVTITQGPVA